MVSELNGIPSRTHDFQVVSERVNERPFHALASILRQASYNFKQVWLVHTGYNSLCSEPNSSRSDS